MAAMRSPSTATSARRRGAPVPSITVPPRRSRSHASRFIRFHLQPWVGFRVRFPSSATGAGSGTGFAPAPGSGSPLGTGSDTRDGPRAPIMPRNACPADAPVQLPSRARNPRTPGPVTAVAQATRDPARRPPRSDTRISDVSAGPGSRAPLPHRRRGGDRAAHRAGAARTRSGGGARRTPRPAAGGAARVFLRVPRPIHAVGHGVHGPADRDRHARAKRHGPCPERAGRGAAHADRGRPRRRAACGRHRLARRLPPVHGARAGAGLHGGGSEPAADRLLRPAGHHRPLRRTGRRAFRPLWSVRLRPRVPVRRDRAPEAAPGVRP